MNPSQLIVALDVRGKQDALNLVERLKPVGLKHVKVGMSLFYEEGIGLIETLKAQGLEVFVDLKLHDIPHTVARTVDVLIQGGATFLNVHCLGGLEMMQRASEQAQKSRDALGIPAVHVIGVTILTSHQSQAFGVDLQTQAPIKQWVLHLAKQAKQAGLCGVVCSPEEASLLKDALGEDFLKVTPGIRPHGYGKVDDQARILTPQAALTQGATHLVVGRPIYESPEPEVVFQSILASMKDASSRLGTNQHSK
jgi:orotidine-5'-phosphate decarboxylase